MCNNAMTYNGPETVYYAAAKNLLTVGIKIIAKVHKLHTHLSAMAVATPGHNGRPWWLVSSGKRKQRSVHLHATSHATHYTWEQSRWTLLYICCPLCWLPTTNANHTMYVERVCEPQWVVCHQIISVYSFFECRKLVYALT